MDRYLVISSDCHAGLPPERYRDYLDPQYREAFDVALPIQIEATQQAIRDTAGLEPTLSTGGGTSDGRFIAPTG